MSETTVLVAPKPSLVAQAKAGLAQFRAEPIATVNRLRLELFSAVMLTMLFLSATMVGAQTDPEPIVRPTLELDVDTMLYYMFEGANIIIVALGAVVFLTIGFVLGRKILDLIRQAISSL
jgi:hypothetical protein